MNKTDCHSEFIDTSVSDFEHSLYFIVFPSICFIVLIINFCFLWATSSLRFQGPMYTLFKGKSFVS